MKARVKSNGEIIEVVKDGPFYNVIDGYERYYEHELDFQDLISYWDKLLHQYAGMAMQGLMSREYLDNPDSLVSHAIHYAHALVEKMKSVDLWKKNGEVL